jgi:hypothetical protein
VTQPASSSSSSSLSSSTASDVATPPRKSPNARIGAQNGATQLDEWDVCFIRSMSRVWGLSIAEIARRRNMPRTTVRDIVRRRTWTHV